MLEFILCKAKVLKQLSVAVVMASVSFTCCTESVGQDQTTSLDSAAPSISIQKTSRRNLPSSSSRNHDRNHQFVPQKLIDPVLLGIEEATPEDPSALSLIQYTEVADIESELDPLLPLRDMMSLASPSSTPSLDVNSLSPVAPISQPTDKTEIMPVVTADRESLALLPLTPMAVPQATETIEENEVSPEPETIASAQPQTPAASLDNTALTLIEQSEQRVAQNEQRASQNEQRVVQSSQVTWDEPTGVTSRRLTDMEMPSPSLASSSAQEEAAATEAETAAHPPISTASTSEIAQTTPETSDTTSAAIPVMPPLQPSAHLPAYVPPPVTNQVATVEMTLDASSVPASVMPPLQPSAHLPAQVPLPVTNQVATVEMTPDVSSVPESVMPPLQPSAHLPAQVPPPVANQIATADVLAPQPVLNPEQSAQPVTHIQEPTAFGTNTASPVATTVQPAFATAEPTLGSTQPEIQQTSATEEEAYYLIVLPEQAASAGGSVPTPAAAPQTLAQAAPIPTFAQQAYESSNYFQTALQESTQRGSNAGQDQLNNQDRLGKAPDKPIPYFLRDESVLLKAGELQVDWTLQYLTDTSDSLLVSVNNNVVSIADVTRHQRLLLAPLEFRLGLGGESQVFLNVPFGWSNSEVVFAGTDEFSNVLGLGDISLGVTRLRVKGKDEFPDILTSVAISFPTGKQ